MGKSILKRGASKLKRIQKARTEEALRSKYISYYETLPIAEKAILLESRNGKEIDGNIFYIIKELVANPEYASFSLYTITEKGKEKTVRAKLKTIDENALKRVELIDVDSERYYEIAASAKYIVSDATLKNFFVKKDGQIYLNVWHGTPFKVMGRKIKHEPHATGNVQKNFTIADYLLYSNEYMMHHMIEDYMIANTSKAKILLGGYPRNTAFFNEKRKKEIIDKEGLAGKHVYAYMPTHRPSLIGESLTEILNKIEQELSEDEVMFVKIHPLAADSVSFDKYEKVRAYPDSYETYEFLNVSECLLTDYSSVFYDYAITKNKIVLFTYDEEEYLGARGLYEPISSLPFPQVKTVADMIREIRSDKGYDDKAFIEKYCSRESTSAAMALCKRVFLNKKNDLLQESDMPANGNRNVILRAGSLSPGDRTDRLMEFLKKADTKKINYFIAFNKNEAKYNKEVLLNLPDEVYHFGRAGKGYETGDKKKDELLERKRVFGNMRIDEVVEI